MRIAITGGAGTTGAGARHSLAGHPPGPHRGCHPHPRRAPRPRNTSSVICVIQPLPSKPLPTLTPSSTSPLSLPLNWPATSTGSTMPPVAPTTSCWPLPRPACRRSCSGVPSTSSRPTPAPGTSPSSGRPDRPLPWSTSRLTWPSAARASWARVLPLRIVGLRLGEIVDESDIDGQPFDGRWLHLDDAVQAFERAVAFVPGDEEPPTGWWVYHVTAAGPRARAPLVAAGEAPLGYAPRHDFRTWWPEDWQHPPAAPALPAVPSRPIRKVVVFGAGGPLAAATAPLLAETHTVRLTDLRPLAEIVAAGRPQSAGAPLPTILGPPHETREVDVTDYEQVLAACAGMDAIVNCTVFRPESERAFRVNCLGAYNVMRAAVAQGIRRVVHTGPQMVMQEQIAGYRWNSGVGSDVPMRPGVLVYLHSKYMGEEVVRTFAESYGLEVPTFYFNHFANPATVKESSEGVNSFTVSWNDAALALRRGLEVPSLPRPFEIFLISADLPHGYIPNEKAKRLLGWQPRDHFENRWLRQD